MSFASPYSSILWVTGTISIPACEQQMGVEAKARATEEDRVNTTTCMPGTHDKKSSSMTKRPCASPLKFLVTYGADSNKLSVYTLELDDVGVQRTAC